MGRVTFENYGRRANAGLDHTAIAARLPGQRAAERRILPDVMAKLAIDAEDSLIEIGCGTGTLLIPLSFMVAEAHGVDHPDILEALAARCPGTEIRPWPGNFLDLRIDRQFDKVLIYSVVHCLANEDEVMAFVDKAIGCLRPAGRLLLGDLPNRDLKARFLATEAGQAFDQAWRARAPEAPADAPALEDDPELVVVDESLVLRILEYARAVGFEARRLPQPPDLPFGHTREDILIRAKSV